MAQSNTGQRSCAEGDELSKACMPCKARTPSYLLLEVHSRGWHGKMKQGCMVQPHRHWDYKQQEMRRVRIPVLAVKP